MSNTQQVKVLYDFVSQPGTGELTIHANEILTVTRLDVGEGWSEGYNSRGESGLFPAGYVEPISNNVVANTQQQMDLADWGDEDWDDDDSQASTPGNENHVFAPSNVPTSQLPPLPGPNSGLANKQQSQAPTVRKSINRFSTFVKSGGEDYILGIKTIKVKEDDFIYIVDSDGSLKWAANPQPFGCTVDRPKKQSKMKGLKSYIAYQITPNIANSLQVSRRYKHFDWLHERLQEKFTGIPIPSLPDKQIAGRYQEDFIEHRRAQLQSWVNRICRHPVLSQSSVWIHFLQCTNDKKWKQGKRDAEKDELVGAALFYAIKLPDGSGRLETQFVDKQMEDFNRFVWKMDDACKHMFNTAADQSKKYSGPYKREFNKLGNSFGHLAAAFELSNIKSNSSKALNAALKNTNATYDEIGKLYEDEPRHDFGQLCDLMHEYKGILSAWPEILQVHKQTLNKKKEHQRLSNEGKIDSNLVAEIEKRADVVTCSVLAEMNQFQDERIQDFKFTMQTFLQSQINFYLKVVDKLQQNLATYDNI